MRSLDSIREDLLVTKMYTYLSNAAISPIPKQVFKESSKFYQDMSMHGGAFWDIWAEKMEQTRDLYAQFIHAHRDEIGFTHSTSEGMNIIAHMLSSKGSVISNELEFPSSILPWLNRGTDMILVRP